MSEENIYTDLIKDAEDLIKSTKELIIKVQKEMDEEKGETK